MNWADERYIRVYTRDTGDLLVMGWEGRAVLWELMRKLDRAGVLDLGSDLEVLPELLRMPHDVCMTGFERLRSRGVVQVNGKFIVMPNFLAAQEAKQSDKQRQEESRAKRRDLAHAKDAGVTIRDGVSQNVTDGHENGQNVTAGHTVSQPVTDGHSVPIRAVPSVPIRAVPSTRGRAVSTEQGSLPGVPEPPANEDPHAGWPEIQGAWWQAYREMTGKDPSPNKRQWGQLKRVLHDRANGDAAEVIRRIGILFAAPPKFLAGSPPDFATLEEHWEKLAAPSGSAKRPTPDDLGVEGLLQFADEWDRRNGGTK
jgi:hypothetical protein